METELVRLKELIEREKQYAMRCDSESQRNVISAKINIMENFISAVLTKIENIDENNRAYILQLEKQSQDQRSQLIALETICLLHGIDDWKAFFLLGRESLQNKLERDQADDCIRVPNKLRKIIYGK